MGITHLELSVINPADRRKFRRVKFLVDSGAVYSLVPEGLLDSLDIQEDSKYSFILADGSVAERGMGGAIFSYGSRIGFAPVAFGEKGDVALLGATALEALGLGLDPLKRKLIAIPIYA